MDGSSRTMLQVAAIIGVLVVLVAGWVLRERELRNRSEEDLIRRLQQTSEAPEAALGSFDGATEDPALAARLLSVSRTLQGPISTCRAQWPGAPVQVRVRVVSDPAGRLEQLAVEGAPKAVSDCLLAVMRRGQFPRNADGVGLLVLDPG